MTNPTLEEMKMVSTHFIFISIVSSCVQSSYAEATIISKRYQFICPLFRFVKLVSGVGNPIYLPFDDDEVGHILEQFTGSLYAVTDTMYMRIVS